MTTKQALIDTLAASVFHSGEIRIGELKRAKPHCCPFPCAAG